MNEVYAFDKMSGNDFEYFCKELLIADGFENVCVTRASGDFGIDITAKSHGIKYGFQCKCYTGSVGNDAINEVFAGAKYYQCDISVVITNSTFTKAAKEIADRIGVKLWDRDELIRLAKKHDLLHIKNSSNSSYTSTQEKSMYDYSCTNTAKSLYEEIIKYVDNGQYKEANYLLSLMEKQCTSDYRLYWAKVLIGTHKLDYEYVSTNNINFRKAEFDIAFSLANDEDKELINKQYQEFYEKAKSKFEIIKKEKEIANRKTEALNYPYTLGNTGFMHPISGNDIIKKGDFWCKFLYVFMLLSGIVIILGGLILIIPVTTIPVAIFFIILGILVVKSAKYYKGLINNRIELRSVVKRCIEKDEYDELTVYRTKWIKDKNNKEYKHLSVEEFKNKIASEKAKTKR